MECTVSVSTSEPADLLVIFGITGDLARKMTFRALYRLERRKLLDCPILGVASDDIGTAELVSQAREAITATGEDLDEAVFARLAERLSYLSGDVTDDALYHRLAQKMGRARRPLFYLEKIGRASCRDRGRVWRSVRSSLRRRHE